MKTIKRVFTMLLIVAMLLSCFPIAALADSSDVTPDLEAQALLTAETGDLPVEENVSYYLYCPATGNAATIGLNNYIADGDMPDQNELLEDREWVFKKSGEYFLLYNPKSELYITTTGNDNGNWLIAKEYTGDSSQLWKLTMVGTNTFKMESVSAGKLFSEANPTGKTFIHLWDGDGTNALQQWTVVSTAYEIAPDVLPEAKDDYLIVTDRDHRCSGPMQDVTAVLQEYGQGSYYLGGWVRLANAVDRSVAVNLGLQVTADTTTWPQTGSVEVQGTDWVYVSAMINVTWNGTLKEAFTFPLTLYSDMPSGANEDDYAYKGDLEFDGFTLNYLETTGAFTENLLTNPGCDVDKIGLVEGWSLNQGGTLSTSATPEFDFTGAVENSDGSVTYPKGYVPVTDKNIKYIGRWVEQSNGAYRGSFEGYCEINFTGTEIYLITPTSGTATLILDGGTPVTTTMYGAYKVATDLADGQHTLRIYSYAQQGLPAIGGFMINENASTIPAQKKPVIEFVGDSILEGYVGSAGNPENSYLYSYGYKTGELLDWDYNTVAFGGITMTPGYNGSDGMLNRYFLEREYLPTDTDATEIPQWDTSKFVPDYMVINLGTNDSGVPSEEFKSAYLSFVEKIKVAYPDITIFVMTPFTGSHADDIRAIVSSLNDSKVILIDSATWGIQGGADALHPNEASHRIAAEMLYEVIKKFIGEEVLVEEVLGIKNDSSYYVSCPSTGKAATIRSDNSIGDGDLPNQNELLADREWVFEKYGEYFLLRNPESGLYITASGSNNGSGIIAASYNGENSQLWKLTPLGTNTFRMQSVLAGKLFSEESDSGNAKIHLWEGDGTNALQQWTITPCPAAPQMDVAQIGDVSYTSLQAAVNAADADDIVKLVADSTEAVIVAADKTLNLDLNGKNLAKVTVEGEFYGMDTTTDDYVCGENDYGKIGSIVGEYEMAYRTAVTGKGKYYVAVAETDGSVSFHRFYVGITHMALRPSEGGAGYTMTLAGDAKVKSVMRDYGYTVYLTDLEGNAIAGAEAECEGTQADFLGGIQKMTALTVTGVLDEADFEKGQANAENYKICVKAHVTLNGEQFDAITGNIQMTFKDIVEATDAALTNIDKLSDELKAALLYMYNDLGVSKMGWKVDNIKALAEATENAE